MRDRLVSLILAGLAAAALGGCGTEPQAAGSEAAAEAASAESSAGGMTMQHGSHGSTSGGQLLSEERFATALATVVGVNSEGAEITLDHEPLEGVDMGAMTMAFAVADDVDLGAVVPGNRVAIRVKQRRNYTYELVALCAAEDESVACLP
ncbi:MAG: copper-binding protein [Pseudomonadota bacterium]